MSIWKKFKIGWRNFWGTRYRIYENEELIKEIIIYHKRIYITKSLKM